MPPRDSSRTITVWTYQTEAAYARLTSDGVLTADGRRAPHDFRPAYSWLRSVHASTVPASTGRPLLWGYATWSAARETWGYHTPGDRLLTVSLDPDEVLFSDHMNWHFPLNGWMYSTGADHSDDCFSDKPDCSRCRLEDRLYKAADRLSPSWFRDYRRLPQSLQPLFEESWMEGVFTFRRGGVIQATFERIEASAVSRAVEVDPSAPPPSRDGTSLSVTRAARLNHVPSTLEA